MMESPNVTNSSRGCSCLNTQDYLKLISNLAIPLIIGVFTIIISVHQQNVAQTNRDKDVLLSAQRRENDTNDAQRRRDDDKETARVLREEDRNVSRLQREQDRNISRQRREEDREAARIQRADDNETARLQREVDQKIATYKQLQEYELAEKQRILYQTQRAHEVEIAEQNYLSNLKLEDERRKENVLVNYQRHLAKLLLYNHSSVNISYLTYIFILQMRTRSAFRLLDSDRRTILVHTLHRGEFFDKPWTKRESPLYRVNCSGVDFGLPPTHKFSRFLITYDHLDIEQADVRHASFHSIWFANPPSFAFSNFDYTDWSFAELSSVEFNDKMTMNNAIFAYSVLQFVTFDKISMNGVSFQHNTKCKYCVFTGTSLLHARFDNASFSDAKFSFLSMADANMSGGYFWSTKFEHMILDRVDLSGADLFQSTFLNVSMVNCTMNGTNLELTKFIDTYPGKGYESG